MNSLALRIAIAQANATTTWVASVLPVTAPEYPSIYPFSGPAGTGQP
jgi:hypothetical protein